MSEKHQKVSIDNKKDNGVHCRRQFEGRGKKSWLRLVASAILGLIAAYSVISIIKIEYHGRSKIVKTPEQWKEIMAKHPYERKETDVRSPCPMLNTLANHGLIARDGRNIRSDDLFDALMLMGAPPMVTVGILKMVYTQLKEANPEALFLSQFGSLDTLDLDRLTVFGVLEHDVSLTRNDSTQAPYSTSNVIPEYVHRMVRLAELSNQGTKEEGTFTRKNENDARKIRWLESTKYNRHLHFSLFSQFASSTECSLLLDILGRDGSISLPHLKSFLLNESFPEDWYPRNSTYTTFELATKPMICWVGVHQSRASLDLLNALHY